MLLTQMERERKQVAGFLIFFTYQPVQMGDFGTAHDLSNRAVGQTPGLHARELISNSGSSDSLNHELELWTEESLKYKLHGPKTAELSSTLTSPRDTLQPVVLILRTNGNTCHPLGPYLTTWTPHTQHLSSAPGFGTLWSFMALLVNHASC